MCAPSPHRPILRAIVRSLPTLVGAALLGATLLLPTPALAGSVPVAVSDRETRSALDDVPHNRPEVTGLTPGPAIDLPSAPVVARPVAADVAPRVAPRAIDDASFRLTLPFRTQKDGGRWQTSNCGPAILGMVLDGFGVTGQATDDLRFRAHTYQGTVGMRTGTALEHIARVAEDFGVSAHGLYAGEGRFRTWTTDDIRAELRAGRPVMPLVRLYLLPGYEGMGARWGHYILLTGIAPDGFYYSDPLKPDADQGATGIVSADQLRGAMAGSHIPGQAVAFGRPDATLAILSPLR